MQQVQLKVWLGLAAVYLRMAMGCKTVQLLYTLPMSLPSSWSSRPAAVTVKSTMVVMALSSGVYLGLGRRVVHISLKLSLKSTCPCKPNFCSCLAVFGFMCVHSGMQVVKHAA